MLELPALGLIAVGAAAANSLVSTAPLRAPDLRTAAAGVPLDLLSGPGLDPALCGARRSRELAGQPEVVEAMIREQGAAVAHRTLRLPHEQAHPAHGARAQRTPAQAITGVQRCDVTIDRCLAGLELALISLKRLTDVTKTCSTTRRSPAGSCAQAR